VNALYVASRRGQRGVRLNDRSSDAEASQRRQHSEDAMEDADGR
jgi:hypothetical protein